MSNVDNNIITTWFKPTLGVPCHPSMANKHSVGWVRSEGLEAVLLVDGELDIAEIHLFNTT